MKRALLFGGLGLGVIIIGATLATVVLMRDDKATNSSTTKAASLINSGLLNSLEKVDRSKADTSRLQGGLAPPTNTWFSGLALQMEPEPVFSYPNSFRPTSNGFELGLPSVSATSETIIGPHTADVTVLIAGSSTYKIARYDELTIDLGYYSPKDELLATVTLAAGSPYVYLSAATDVVLSLNDAGTEIDGATAINSNGKLFGLYTDGQKTTSNVKMFARSKAVLFSAPDEGSFAELAKYAPNSIMSGSVSYSLRGSDSVTTLEYSTANNKPTIIARLPHQQKTAQASSAISYESILGSLSTTVAKKLEYSVPTVKINESLDIGRLEKKQRALLTEQLKKDSSNLPNERTDTYFGGKQLQRTAQLLLLADQLRVQEQKDKLQDILKVRLAQWLARDGAFEYDTKARTIVGKETSFGADTEVNDHHFHYGYVIYAAAVLAKYDNAFLRRNESAVNLLVADIANYNDDEALPLRRNYDPYFGHSWASGTSPFKDGNNQESTSEAINAWTAVALWAKQTKNNELENQAVWMVSNETAAAKEYWLRKPAINGYTSPLVSIVWGGKREYKTFFSDDPNAKLAILLLPLNPSMREYAASIDKATLVGTSLTRPFADYLLMADSNATIEQAQMLPDSVIDDGNSRSYLYAYVLTK